MNTLDLMRHCVMGRSKFHQDTWNTITTTLPDYNQCGAGKPHCGPHSIGPLRMAVKLLATLTVEPDWHERALEIGFNLGHSAHILLNTPHCFVRELVSVDIASNEHSTRAHQSLGHAHTFVHSDTKDAALYDKLKAFGQFDFAFIDGDHLYAGVKNDIDLCLKLGIKWFIFDDILPEYGPGVAPAIYDSNLQLVAIFGNQAVCCVKPKDWVQ